MSIWDEIDDIKQQKLASDLEPKITAQVLAAERTVKKGDYAGAPLLRLELLMDSGETFTTTYRIPKAWTGKGQLDLLRMQLEKLGVPLNEIVGKTFVWKRMELPGAMKGNARHYPIKLVKK